MHFFSARDLRTVSKDIWDSLREDGELVITTNGHPTALMIDITDDDFDMTLRAVRQARAMMAFNGMRERASRAGFMPDDEIEAEIAAVRAEKGE